MLVKEFPQLKQGESEASETDYVAPTQQGENSVRLCLPRANMQSLRPYEKLLALRIIF